MSDVIAIIQNEIDTNDVVLFMKGTPEFPMCGFSGLVVKVLENLDISYKAINVLESEELRQSIKDFSDWPTIPQLYVNQEFIGGADIVKEMYQSGEFQELFK